jgi:hypothetical protein
MLPRLGPSQYRVGRHQQITGSSCLMPHSLICALLVTLDDYMTLWQRSRWGGDKERWVDGCPWETGSESTPDVCVTYICPPSGARTSITSQHQLVSTGTTALLKELLDVNTQQSPASSKCRTCPSALPTADQIAGFSFDYVNQIPEDWGAIFFLHCLKPSYSCLNTTWGKGSVPLRRAFLLKSKIWKLKETRGN